MSSFLFLWWTFFSFSVALPRRILLSDVDTIVLTRGLLTNGRRSDPVPQLVCVENQYSAPCQDDYPYSATCMNLKSRARGGHWNSIAEWHCETVLPDELKLERIEVSCEGYDYPEDDYILEGSCGLEYTLGYRESLPASASASSSPDSYYRPPAYNPAYQEVPPSAPLSSPPSYNSYDRAPASSPPSSYQSPPYSPPSNVQYQKEEKQKYDSPSPFSSSKTNALKTGKTLLTGRNVLIVIIIALLGGSAYLYWVSRQNETSSTPQRFAEPAPVQTSPPPPTPQVPPRPSDSSDPRFRYIGSDNDNDTEDLNTNHQWRRNSPYDPSSVPSHTTPTAPYPSAFPSSSPPGFTYSSSSYSTTYYKPYPQPSAPPAQPRPAPMMYVFRSRAMNPPRPKPASTFASTSRTSNFTSASRPLSTPTSVSTATSVGTKRR